MDIYPSIEQLITVLPIELFVLIGSFLEEVIAPIPSPFVMTTATVIAVQKNYAWWGFVLLILLGSLGKTLACWLVYILADKSEDLVAGRFGKFLGINHNQIEDFGKRFSSGRKDIYVLFFLRAFPLGPAFIASFVSGVIKINIITFLSATFFGTAVRNVLYVIVGVYGLQWIDTEFIQANLPIILGSILLGGIILLGILGYKLRLKKN